MNRRIVSLAAGAALLVNGCSAAPGGDHAYAPITVYAASSLRVAFDEIARDVERRTGAKVQVQYAGSSTLAEQLAQGAPADVFASADEAPMDTARRAGVMDRTTTVFAQNALTVVTPPANPGKVQRLRDLARVTTVVCAPQVPCGTTTSRLFEKAGVRVHPVSEESSVADVLGKVRSGQADAGVVYVTDAKAAGAAVHAVPTPEGADIHNRYPIALTTHGADDPGRRGTAEAFVAAVVGKTGQQILGRSGFAPVTPSAPAVSLSPAPTR